MKMSVILVLFYTFSVCVYSQDKEFKGWLPAEISYYNNLKGLAEYVNGKSDVNIDQDSIIHKFLKIEEASRDSVNKNTVYSIEYRNGVFTSFVGSASSSPTVLIKSIVRGWITWMPSHSDSIRKTIHYTVHLFRP